jgi:hypothetical protein
VVILFCCFSVHGSLEDLGDFLEIHGDVVVNENQVLFLLLGTDVNRLSRRRIWWNYLHGVKKSPTPSFSLNTYSKFIAKRLNDLRILSNK